ncbi:1-deoxy-D-xylulose-5-phosphate synthase [Bacteroidales bacterium]|nr:1-deoxy-D-xylulose-5-phosphate synthase [Bacteroidales bacterium]
MTQIKQYNLLDSINYPIDLRALKPEQLKRVCAELRQFIIDVLAENPGHFASSLGTIELTVALHYVLNTPYDKIVWDVGHQAYGHKILTGRKNVFQTLRKLGGICGFPNPEESEYDSFIAGHASTAISAALGMAIASSLKGEKNKKIVAVIGDGSMTGGLAFEGLNNASSAPNNVLIILNDNNMAIDDNVGGISQYLVNITTSQIYNNIRYKLYKAFRKYNIIEEGSKGAILRFNNSLKSLLTKQHNMFEGFNIRYFGPVDGHDVDGLVKVLNDIKEMEGPKLLHVKTIKGKGFKLAEESSTIWHAPGKFNKETGERLAKSKANEAPLFQDVFGNTLVELAKANEKIVGITPAMPTGCSMGIMMKKIPERAFDVGIAEAHAVTFSAGLAKEGMLPFCNIYSSFAQRAYDQIIHDAALQKLDIVLCLDRAGLVGEDGATHHGAFDLAFLRCIPNLTICSPMDEHDLRNLMYTGAQKGRGVFVIRYPRGKGSLIEWENKMKTLSPGKGRKIKDGNDLAVISIGPIGMEVKQATDKLSKDGIEVAHYDIIYLKPIDEDLLHEVGKKYKTIITVENAVITGGLGTAVIEFMSANGYCPRIKKIGIPDQFIEHGTSAELNELCKMDAKSIYQSIYEEVNTILYSKQKQKY